MRNYKKERIPLQIKLAREIIKNCPNLALGEVSNLVNIPDRSNFRKYFRKRYGMSPRKYKSLIVEFNRRKMMKQIRKRRIFSCFSYVWIITGIRYTRFCNILYKIVYICKKNKTNLNGK